MAKKIRIPNYTLGEEITNAITHGLGAIFSIVALVMMIVKAAHDKNTALCFVVLAVYGTFMFITYIISDSTSSSYCPTSIISFSSVNSSCSYGSASNSIFRDSIINISTSN